MTDLEPLLLACFPGALASDACALTQRVPWRSALPSGQSFTVTVAGGPMHIPQRVYFEPSVLTASHGLSNRQERMLHCVFTRHHDGHVREASLRRIIDSPEPWVVPFVVQLAGEYVIEILEVIATHLGSLDLTTYCAFLRDNPRFYLRTRARVMSYWNCYYRRAFPRRRGYPGFAVLELFEAQCGGVAR